MLIMLVALTMTGATACGAITIDTVTVGCAGNAANGGLYGAVSYEYQIGKTEVTNAQYVAFLNAVATEDTDISQSLYSMTDSVYYGITRTSDGDAGYSYSVKSGEIEYANKPVTHVSYYDAARFVNWLTNGQGGAGTTESGLYVFEGVNNLVSTPVHAAAAAGSGGWVIASEDEWYKAAYYDPDKEGEGIGGYWVYPIRSDSISKSLANYDNNSGNANDLKEVASYTEGTSYFGTYDQGGNVLEWNDTIFTGNYHVLRGGSFASSDANGISSVYSRYHYGLGPADELPSLGFRVAYLTSVPEPGTWAGAAGLIMLVIGVWVRRDNRVRRG
jgi:formylglycine-generating enzyme required for sulfatase activity